MKFLLGDLLLDRSLSLSSPLLSVMASSPQKNLSQTNIDFDLIMPSSEIIMEFVLPAPAITPSVHDFGEAQGKEDDSPLKLLHQKSFNTIEGISSPDPRWPLLIALVLS